MNDFLKQRHTWLAFTVVLGIVFLVIICLFIFLREVTGHWSVSMVKLTSLLQRILIAIALISQGSRAVGHMFSSLFFPIIPWLFQLVSVCRGVSSVECVLCEGRRPLVPGDRSAPGQCRRAGAPRRLQEQDGERVTLSMWRSEHHC